MVSPWDRAGNTHAGRRSRDNVGSVSQSDRRLGTVYDQGEEGEGDAIRAVEGGSGLHDESGGGRYLVNLLNVGVFGVPPRLTLAF